MINTLSLRIKELRESNSWSQEVLADKLNTTKQSISNWEIGKRKPDYETLEAIADIFNVDIDFLFGRKDTTTIIQNPLSRKLSDKEKEILMPFNKLNGEGQNKVINYTYDLLDSDKYVEEEVASYIGYAAAGSGYNYLDDIKVDITIPKKDRPNYDFIIKVTGDSMAPKIKDGNIAFVKVNTDYDNGKIYVVDNDGSVFIKKVYFEQDRIILRSINKKYGDIEITFSDGFRVLGEVVDWE